MEQPTHAEELAEVLDFPTPEQRTGASEAQNLLNYMLDVQVDVKRAQAGVTSANRIRENFLERRKDANVRILHMPPGTLYFQGGQAAELDKTLEVEVTEDFELEEFAAADSERRKFKGNEVSPGIIFYPADGGPAFVAVGNLMRFVR